MSKKNPLINPDFDGDVPDVNETADAPKESRFAQLEREALADYVPAEPYVVDHVTPPIVITEPIEIERVVVFAELFSSGGDVRPVQLRYVLEAVCGEAYARVWNELLVGKHINVAKAFLKDVNDHFQAKGPAAGKNGATDVPGGSAAS